MLWGDEGGRGAGVGAGAGAESHRFLLGGLDICRPNHVLATLWVVMRWLMGRMGIVSVVGFVRFVADLRSSLGAGYIEAHRAAGNQRRCATLQSWDGHSEIEQ